MAEEGEDGAKYQLVTENREVKTTSRGFTGQGTATYQNQDVYEGDFKNDQREGNGKYTRANGRVAPEGAWKAEAPAGQPAGGAYAHDAGAFARLAADVARVVEEGVAPVVAAVATIVVDVAKLAK